MLKPAMIILLGIAASHAARAQSPERGKYIVEHTSLCHECHTPRDQAGHPVMSQALQGAPMGSQPIRPIPWADYAPPIAGLPGHFTPEAMVDFLRTGQRPDGSMARPPMPRYRFSREDAVAVMEFIRTFPK